MSSGNTSISTPQNFQPSQGQQQTQNQDYLTMLSQIENQVFGATTPGQVLGPSAVTVGQNAVNNPYATLATQGALNAVGPGQQVQQTGINDLAALTQAGNQVLSTGFDPQQALFNQTQGQVLDQASVANAMAGLGSSPYGASQTANTLSNFDINWQAQQAARQQAALGAATTAFGQGIGDAATGIQTGVSTAAQPYSTYNTQQANAISNINNAIQAANLQYAIPQQTLQDIMSFLNFGQDASKEASGINAQNLKNTQSIFSGIGQGIGALPGTIASFASLFG